MRALYSTLAAVVVAALALPGGANAQQKITIGIPTSPPNIVHMPVIVAKELGLYKKAGLDVDIVSLGDGVKVYRALLAGNIDLGLTPGAPTIIGRANGATVKAVSANLPKLEASLVVRADIKTMADLKGKRIGIQEPGGFADLLSRSVLRAAKIDPKEVNFVSIASEDVPALVANQVDTAILHVEQEMNYTPWRGCGSWSPRRSIRSCRRPKRRSRTRPRWCRPLSRPTSKPRASCIPRRPR